MILRPDGKPALTQQKMALSRTQIRRFIEFEEVLKQLGLSLFCLNCHKLGLPDGVSGGNDPHGTEFHVSCGCTDRVYRETSPGVLSAS